jgi:hypothetical protein
MCSFNRKPKFRIALLLLSGITAFGMQPSFAQQFVCPAGSSPGPVPGPPGAFGCRCPDGSGASLYGGCPRSNAAPNPNVNTAAANNAATDLQRLISWLENWSNQNVPTLPPGSNISTFKAQQDQPAVPNGYVEPSDYNLPSTNWQPLGTNVETGFAVPVDKAIRDPVNNKPGWLPSGRAPQTNPNTNTNLPTGPTIPPSALQIPSDPSLATSNGTAPGTTLNPDLYTSQKQLTPSDAPSAPQQNPENYRNCGPYPYSDTCRGQSTFK